MPTTILDDESYQEALQRRYANETRKEEILDLVGKSGAEIRVNINGPYPDSIPGGAKVWRPVFDAEFKFHSFDQLEKFISLVAAKTEEQANDRELREAAENLRDALQSFMNRTNPTELAAEFDKARASIAKVTEGAA